MKAITVDRPIEVTGKDFFGRDASLRIAPAHKPGWWWKIGEQIDGSDVLIPITPDLIKVKSRRICFEYNGMVLLNIVEHITILRMIGLDSIILSSKTPWPPYLTSYELLMILSFKSLGYDLESKQIFKSGIHMSGNRYSIVSPGDGENIKLDIIIDYANIGKKQKSWHILQRKDVMKIVEKGSHSQGWPMWQYHLATVASAYLKWPHLYKFVWPQQHNDKDNILNLFILHRALDILAMIGAMSLSSNKILCCSFMSIKGGHKLDVLAFRKALNL